MEVRAGLKRTAVSRDTTAVGAEARAVESSVVGWLGRVKGRAPGSEFPDRRCRESGDKDHRGGTFGTTEASGRGSGTGCCRWVGLWVGPQQTLTEREELGSTAIGQESEETDAYEAARQNMEEETAQELLRGERHHSLLFTVGIIVPAESNLVAVEGHEAVVGDGHAMSVTGEIAHDGDRQKVAWRRRPSSHGTMDARRSGMPFRWLVV